MRPRIRRPEPGPMGRDAMPGDPPEGGATQNLGGVEGGPPPTTPSAPFPAAVSRAVAVASARLARLVPGNEGAGRAGRTSVAADAGFDEALRHAFRSAGPLEPARPAPRPAGAVEPLHGDPVAAVDVSAAETSDGPDAVATRELEADSLDGTEASGTVDATTGLDGTEAVTRPNAVPEPAAGGPPADGPARPSGREPGSTAAAALLEAPESVAATADDFFGGLVRRVDRRA